MRLEALEEEASRQVRKVMHEGRWFFSVIDVVGLLTESARPRAYWDAMKRRLADDEGFREVSTNCRQLKMTATDGKQRLTDCADTETLLRIIQSIPSPRAEPFKQWLARVGTERLAEIESPERMTDHLRQQYRRAGYSTEWINARLRNVMARDELTDEWRERGAKEGRDYARLTDIEHKGWSDLTTAEHKALKHLPKRANLRDNETSIELALETLTEVTATALHQAHDSQGMPALTADAHEAGDVGGAARRDVEARLGRPVVSGENARSLTARTTQPGLFAPSDASPDGEGSSES
ncbi:MAG: Bro-N domain-containing protein [Chloroflexota bacterium]|nr:Bro-N domain-containing protein [Chloroflexota bacterium]